MIILLSCLRYSQLKCMLKPYAILIIRRRDVMKYCMRTTKRCSQKMKFANKVAYDLNTRNYEEPQQKSEYEYS
jgi:hypothetical protein